MVPKQTDLDSMTTVAEHYANHLAAIYLWMAGGPEAALQAGTAEIEALSLPLTDGAAVLDLGAGFGMHAIPLARRGARVTAIDTASELLRALEQLAGNLPIQTVNDDLLVFQSHITEKPSAILCMGDTITHLPDRGTVEGLIERASIELPSGGIFVVSFQTLRYRSSRTSASFLCGATTIASLLASSNTSQRLLSFTTFFTSARRKVGKLESVTTASSGCHQST